jgi:hypothetical protein
VEAVPSQYELLLRGNALLTTRNLINLQQSCLDIWETLSQLSHLDVEETYCSFAE